MTSKPTTAARGITLDPRTEELLREIAAQPGACVLRASRRELDEALTRVDYRGLQTRVGLSAAERELMRTARFELAYWLNVLCYRRLTEDEETRRYYTRLGAGDREFVPPSTEDIASGARAASAAAGELRVDELSTAEVLMSAVAAPGGRPSARRPSVLELAAASLRLQPTFQARHYALQARVVDERTVHLALPAAGLLVTASCGRVQLGHSLALLGTLSGVAGRFSEALHSYRRAADLLPDHTELVVRSLVAARHVGDRSAQESLLAIHEARGVSETVWATLLRARGHELTVPRAPQDRLTALTRTSASQLGRRT